MPIISIIVTLVIVGVVLWAINTLIPMDDKVKTILNVVVLLLILLWLLQVFGVPIGKVHAAPSYTCQTCTLIPDQTLPPIVVTPPVVTPPTLPVTFTWPTNCPTYPARDYDRFYPLLTTPAGSYYAGDSTGNPSLFSHRCACQLATAAVASYGKAVGEYTLWVPVGADPATVQRVCASGK